MTRIFAALLFLLAAPLHAEFATRIHYAPNVVRHGQTSPVQEIVGTNGPAPKLSIECNSGVTVAMMPIGGGVFTASVAARPALLADRERIREMRVAPGQWRNDPFCFADWNARCCKLLSPPKLTATVSGLSAGVYNVVMKATNGSVKVIRGLTIAP